MSMFQIFNISGSAVSAQSQRLNVVASNLANVDTVAGPMAASTRPARWCSRPSVGRRAVRRRARGRGDRRTTRPAAACTTPSTRRPTPQGYVTYANVNTIEEMVNMISASRSYQNNVEVMNTAKNLLQKTLQLGQGS
jgi:flagellar basal-body rod protein FlgC